MNIKEIIKNKQMEEPIKIKMTKIIGYLGIGTIKGQNK
jgi:hypothetical protein